ncbi:hypothetical protein QCD60_08330 [Pokkaliibacter sp. MBI-7]|uniref:hypothetical protein n=1 Tax=Pokkaliibacter sp. MBI-7 TaxID=3040600 RepID=UPI00244A313A|nr:hypothetical protein [Pokkaliibacter sp. MBI-7]MDH2432571.1 hypothetical protein [Pokkaliibacter sp. MBI-7]
MSRLLLVLGCLFGLTGCASLAEQAKQRAIAGGLRSEVLTATPFHLQSFQRTPRDPAVLHIYIEGDGRPWLAHGRYVSADPTPDRTPALDWLLQDKDGALYLGRPCYFNTDASPPCSARLWTLGRYSEEVVARMAVALQGWLAQQPVPPRQVKLVGYSGGGVLAVLVAERVPAVTSVLAIAAPLDIDAWSRAHDYSLLTDSINPATQRQWRDGVRRVLVLGQRDDNVPLATLTSALAAIPIELTVIPGEDHHCCRWSVLQQWLVRE